MKKEDEIKRELATAIESYENFKKEGKRGSPAGTRKSARVDRGIERGSCPGCGPERGRCEKHG